LKLHIKNMVCIRCKMIVKEELEKLGLHYFTIDLGETEILENISAGQHDAFKISLLRWGLELMDDKKSILIEKIKNVIINLIYFREEPLNIKFSEFLAQELKYDYTYLANLFSEAQDSTIEKFVITTKIERVKELLIYNELSLTQISYLMHYSSVAHLSAQFKKATGFTASYFKQLKDKRRLLENV
jgi:AraC-like DNA-binding protein